ncbi:MAG: hypothetical protein Q9177_006883 [Variospora cf. flavescens]
MSDKYRILEDGSQTQYRLCVIESLIPPNSDGPVFHFHEMHDEGFYVTKGKVRFHSPGRGHLDAGQGDFVTVPIRLPHKFSNPFDEEAVFINTITPGFFVRYFEYLEELIGEGTTLTPEANMAALKRFATVPLTDEMIKQFEEVQGRVDERQGDWKADSPPGENTVVGLEKRDWKADSPPGENTMVGLEKPRG